MVIDQSISLRSALYSLASECVCLSVRLGVSDHDSFLDPVTVLRQVFELFDLRSDHLRRFIVRK